MPSMRSLGPIPIMTESSLECVSEVEHHRMLRPWVQPLATKCKSNINSENLSKKAASGRITAADPPVANANTHEVQGLS